MRVILALSLMLRDTRLSGFVTSESYIISSNGIKNRVSSGKETLFIMRTRLIVRADHNPTLNVVLGLLTHANIFRN